MKIKEYLYSKLNVKKNSINEIGILFHRKINPLLENPGIGVKTQAKVKFHAIALENQVNLL